MENDNKNTQLRNLKDERDEGMKSHYYRFLIMIVLMFITMYALMYAFVGGHSNTNQFQMTVLMTAPMVLIEIILMNELYRNRKLNLVIVLLSVA